MSTLTISWKDLSEEALQGIIEEYVTREGTEYGAEEVPLSDKCQQVLDQLKRNEAVITWDEDTQSCSIVVR